MNPKFFALPQEKQQAVLNAGFHVFSQNTYKKSPMSEIAEAAGISKALLDFWKKVYLRKEREGICPGKEKEGACSRKEQEEV